jgi:hypothetical protein
LVAKRNQPPTLAQLRARADQINNMTAFELSRLPTAQLQALQKEAFSIASQLEKRGGAVDEARINNLNEFGNRMQDMLEQRPNYNGIMR